MSDTAPPCVAETAADREIRALNDRIRAMDYNRDTVTVRILDRRRR